MCVLCSTLRISISYLLMICMSLRGLLLSYNFHYRSRGQTWRRPVKRRINR